MISHKILHFNAMKCDLKGKSSTYTKRHVRMHSRMIQSTYVISSVPMSVFHNDMNILHIPNITFIREIITIIIIEAYLQQINANFSPCINCTYLKKKHMSHS